MPTISVQTCTVGGVWQPLTPEPGGDGIEECAGLADDGGSVNYPPRAMNGDGEERIQRERGEGKKGAGEEEREREGQCQQPVFGHNR